MDREDALRHFKEHYAVNCEVEKINNLKDYYKNNKEMLLLGFVQCFKELCKKIKLMQNAGVKGDIGFINFSLYRTDILEKRYVYSVDAYNKHWFYDRNECNISYDAIWAFRFLDDFTNEMSEKIKLYINKITPADIDRIMLQQVSKYNEFVVELARYAMSEAVKIPEFKEISREELLSFRVGEYKGNYEIVYVIDDRIKDSREVKHQLELKDETGYQHEVLKNLDLSKGEYDEIDLSHTDFSSSNLSYSSMKRCNLKHIKFEETNLDGTDFGGSDLSFSIFRNVTLYNTNFQGVALDGAIFSKNAFLSANLDEEQKKGIRVE